MNVSFFRMLNCVSLLSTFLLAFELTNSASGQSTPIQLPGAPDFNSSDSLETQSPDVLPNNLPPQVRHTEKILARAIPSSLSGKMFFGKFIEGMNRQVVTTVVLESANDAGFDDEARIDIKGAGASIATNLRLFLNEYDCSYQVDRSGIVVISSKEEMEERLFSMMIDVTSLDSDPWKLVDNISEIVVPESWEDAGGTGRLAIHSNNGKTLLEVSNTYLTIREVRNQLSDLTRLSGASNSVAGPSRQRIAGSTVVMVPGMGDRNSYDGTDPYSRDRRNSGGGFGGGGRGGSGLGGGIF